MLQAGRSRVHISMRSLDFFFFSIYLTQPHYGPGVDSASNRNKYQKMFLASEALPARKADNLPK
jgi:hypothetical protein